MKTFSAVLLLAVGLPLHAQESTEPLSFEVASVRPSEPGSPTRGVTRPANGLVRAGGTTLRQLVRYAYDIQPIRHDPQPEGGLEWIDNERFDIQARGPDDLSLPDSRLMMRTLLADRFALQVHRESRPLPVYLLVVAGGDRGLGSGLRPSDIDCSVYSATLARTGRGVLAQQVNPRCGLTAGGGPAVATELGPASTLPRGSLLARGTATMAELLTIIIRSPDIDRQIIDRTGLSGTFDIDLAWVPLRAGPAAAAPVDVISIFSAVEEQLGLKLEPATSPVDVLVIDHAERPMPN